MRSTLKLITLWISLFLLSACPANKRLTVMHDFNPRNNSIGVVSLFDESFVVNYSVLNHPASKYRSQHHEDSEWAVAKELADGITNSINIGQKSIQDITGRNHFLTSGFFVEDNKVSSKYLEHLASLPETQEFDLLMIIAEGSYVLPGTSSEMMLPVGYAYIPIGKTKGQSVGGYGFISGGNTPTSIFISVDAFIVDQINKRTLVVTHASKFKHVSVQREPDSGELRFLYSRIKNSFANEDARDRVKNILDKSELTEADKQEVIRLYTKYGLTSSDDDDGGGVSFVAEALYPANLPLHKATDLFREKSTMFDAAFHELQDEVVMEIANSINSHFNKSAQAGKQVQ